MYKSFAPLRDSEIGITGVTKLSAGFPASAERGCACDGDVAWLARKRSARNVSYGHLEAVGLDAFDDHHRNTNARDFDPAEERAVGYGKVGNLWNWPGAVGIGGGADFTRLSNLQFS